jgi:hypothetical protein
MTCNPGTTDWSCYGAPDEVALIEPDVKERAELFAWMTLESLTAHAIKTCPTSYRPSRRPCREGSSGFPFAPFLRDGNWYNSCGCYLVNEVTLPGPVGNIISVEVDGTLVPASAYRLDNGNRLVRQDGEPWPACQDMNLPAGATGTFVVEYVAGASADVAVNFAAGVLAKEYLLACNGKKCRLPNGVTSVVRQGVSYEIQGNMFENGFTGITEVDVVVRYYNPNQVRSTARVASIDTMRSGRSTVWSRP